MRSLRCFVSRDRLAAVIQTPPATSGRLSTSLLPSGELSSFPKPAVSSVLAERQTWGRGRTGGFQTGGKESRLSLRPPKGSILHLTRLGHAGIKNLAVMGDRYAMGMDV